MVPCYNHKASTIEVSNLWIPIQLPESEIDFTDKEANCVMAVDNLPCELPRDASGLVLGCLHWEK